MNAPGHSQDGPGSRRLDKGGLPADDEDLDAAFGAAARQALGPSVAQTKRPPLAAVPASAAEPASAPSSRGLTVPSAPAAPDPLPSNETAADVAPEPATPDAELEVTADQAREQDYLTQETPIVAVDVAERFRRYRRMQASKGPTPTNAQIVFDALNHADGRYREIIAARLPKPDPDVRFAAGPRQKTTTEARPTTQINFKLTHSHKKEITAIASAAGARSVSALLDAVLDEFLPPLPRSARSPRANPAGQPGSPGPDAG
jgi:hypothetical protein